MSKSTKDLLKIVLFVAIFAVVLVFIVIFGAGRKPSGGYSPSPTPSQTEGAVSTTEKQDEKSSTTIENTTKEETFTADPGRKSFYDGLNYRSPTAKPTDVFKHGRNLMLVNNDYELPENFQWDLVYWSNGKSVDALSLNSEAYDTVVAVDRAVYEPLTKMFEDAAKAGYPLQMVSAYRSIDMQDRRFTREVNQFMAQGYSKEEAIKKVNYSRTFPGTSEHHIGLGVDILEKGQWNLVESFENTPTAKWLRANAENYGFVLRYDKDKVDITGIMYEPWHFRYVGVEHAKKMNQLGMCLEEYIEYLES